LKANDKTNRWYFEDSFAKGKDSAMKGKEALSNVGIGLVGGLIGKMLMQPVSNKLYRWEPEAVRQREIDVRPGLPADIAAEKIRQRLNLDLSQAQTQKLGRVLFYGAGMAWGPIYTLLRNANFHPLAAGLVTGAAMSAVVDEIMTPGLDLSAPNRAYPLLTHLRGFAAHLVYGLAVMATVEMIAGLGRTIARRAEPAEFTSLMGREEAAVSAT